MKAKAVIEILKSPLQFWEVIRITGRLPENHPGIFKKQSRFGDRIVACLGDSITHGNVSYDWVSNLRVRFDSANLQFMNAGINGNVAWQLNQRMSTILSSKPHLAIVLIGTNDVMGSFHRADGESYKRQGSLPNLPSRLNYQQELRKLLRSLHSVQHVGVCTLPPLGENPHSQVNQLVAEFNHDIREIAAEENTTLLPFGEMLFEILESQRSAPKEDYQPGPLNRLIPIIRALNGYYIRGETWDQTASNRGLELLPDHIHLGEQAGLVLADLVSNYIAKTWPDLEYLS